MRSARTQSVEDFSDEMLVKSLKDQRSVEIVRMLGLGLSVSVPLIAHGRLLGAISLIGKTAFRFGAEDVALAEQLARRAAVSIDNARLYTEHTRIARPFRPACCRGGSRIPALSWRPVTAQPVSSTRSGVTSMTSTCARPESGSSSSGMSPARGPRRPPPRHWSATRCAQPRCARGRRATCWVSSIQPCSPRTPAFARWR